MRRSFVTRVLAFAPALLLLVGCAPMSLLITPVSASRQLEEHVVVSENAWSGHKIALIDVDGMISNQRKRSLVGVGGENPVSLFKEKLDRAARDRRVKAVVLRINSPGGTVTASDLMYRELCKFREKTEKPVVASMLDLAASGGYYLACACDAIYAMPATVTGSIGVVMMLPNVSDGLARIGIHMETIKSGGMKDAGSPFRAMGAPERAHFQGIIDEMYADFVDVVASGRSGLSEERVRALADGRVFLGREAKEVGLVDEIGDVQDAIVAAKQRAGLGDAAVRVVQYARPHGYRPNVYAHPAAPQPVVNLINIDTPWSAGTPQFMYMWSPGW